MVLAAALHCMVNGPVGIKKVTNFPGIEGETSIYIMLSHTGITSHSNKTWKSFCKILAEGFSDEQKQLLSSKSYTMLSHGDFWPLYEPWDHYLFHFVYAFLMFLNGDIYITFHDLLTISFLLIIITIIIIILSPTIIFLSSLS